MTPNQAEVYERFMSFFSQYGRIGKVTGKQIFDVFYINFELETDRKQGNFDFFIPKKGNYVYRYNPSKEKRYMYLENAENNLRMKRVKQILPNMV